MSVGRADPYAVTTVSTFHMGIKKVEITSPLTQSPPMLGVLYLSKSHLIATDGPLAGLEQHFRSN